MKLGPLDFNQPSTWRGLLGLLALGGWALSPELRDQIALALAAALSAIELFRDEYRARNASACAPTTGPNRAADADAERLRVPTHDAPTQRNPVPAIADTPDLDAPHFPSGFGDR